ncbi:MAG: EVE domain-containing protein [Pseudomonadota bacterium]
MIAEAHPDSTTDDDRWECVDIKAIGPIPNPVTLDMCKAEPALADMVLSGWASAITSTRPTMLFSFCER